MAKEAVMVLSVEQVPGSGIKMQSEVWSRLPTGLIERVLMCLGIADEARLAAVCKAWRRLFLSNWFRAERAALGFNCCNLFWILECLSHNYYDVEPLSLNRSPKKELFRQVRLDLNFLPSEYREFPNWSSAAGMRGLIFIHSRKDGSSCICNLANKTWRVLPLVASDGLPARILSRVHVVVSDEHGVSTIEVWAKFWDLARGEAYLAVCSSTNWVWNKVVRLEPPSSARPDFVHSLVVCNGIMYVIPNMYSQTIMEYYDIVTGKYLGHESLPEGTWTCFDFGWDLLSVVVGKVFYTCRVGVDRIAIWEWNDRALKWHQTAVLPPDLLESTRVQSVWRMRVQVAAGTILIALFDSDGWYLFAYCVGQNSWRFVFTLPTSSPECFLAGELSTTLRL